MSEVDQNNTAEFRLHKTVVMVGMMGAGKTAVGRTLAAALGVDFVDSDAEIERAATMSIAEIFERDGEPFFRDRESEVIERLLHGPPCILSTGGGAFLAERNRRAIADQGVAVWLNADLETLWQRVRHKDTRPLLRTNDPRKTLETIFNQRVPIYATSEVSVKSDPDVSIEGMAKRVIDALLARPDVLTEETQ